MPSSPSPYFSDLFIIFVSLIFILLAIAFLIYLYKSGIPPSDGTLQCLAGQCTVNRFTGEKICPDNPNDVMSYDPVMLTCSDKFTCSDHISRFAELSDGSTNNNGICENNVACNCYSDARCADNITSFFQVMSGNPYQSFDNQPIVLQQIYYFSAVDANFTTHYFNTPPLHIPSTQVLTSFCRIPKEWLSHAYPAGNGPGAEGTYQPGSLIGQLCLRGVLVYYPDNVENFLNDPDREDNTLLGCVIGLPIQCPLEGQVPYYDNQDQKIKCSPP